MRTVTIVPLLVALTATTYADNWPQWRGPAGTGVSTERALPLRWSDTDGIAWKAQLRGTGVSSPIVWNDRVFVTSQLGAAARREGNHPTLVQSGSAREAGERSLRPASRSGSGNALTFLIEAFARTDGRSVWAFELPAEGTPPAVHEKHNLASASPVTDGERVYAVFGTGQVVAVDMQGKRVWHRNLAAEHGPFEINWGHGSSPIVYGDLVILPCYHEPQSYLLAMDAKTGATRWKIDRGGKVVSYSTPIVIRAGDGDELVLNTSEAIEAYRPATGEALWRVTETSRFAIPMPVHDGGVVYASRGYRSGPYLAVRAGGRGEVAPSHVLWKSPTGAPYLSSLVYADGLLFMAGDVGVVTCIDAKTGERVWQERIDGVFTASPVAGEGRIYLFSEPGETIVMRAARKPEVLARNHIDARLLASPAFSNGWIFFRSDDQIVAVSGRTS
ncbi:MAG TPA: PQQ-binding-like beta-propeller repeat protein [Vicinamibacterales bacterium]|nr:PQQ-binding-like beta-propeller repeat protein [Vicinamibacterales bacterium]